jgi:hypothetical protein
MGGTCSTYTEMIKLENTRPRLRWESNAYMDLKETDYEVVDSFRLRIGSIGGLL